VASVDFQNSGNFPVETASFYVCFAGSRLRRARPSIAGAAKLNLRDYKPGFEQTGGSAGKPDFVVIVPYPSGCGVAATARRLSAHRSVLSKNRF